MINKGQSPDLLREIFDSIAATTGTEPVTDQQIAHLSSDAAKASLDRLLKELSGIEKETPFNGNDLLVKLDEHMKIMDAHNQAQEEDDAFTSHPIEKQPVEIYRENMDAIARFSESMSIFGQLRAKNFPIADAQALRAMFNQIGDGDVVKRAQAAQDYLDHIAQTIDDSMTNFQTVLPFIDRYLKANGNSAVLKGIMNDIEKEKLARKIESAYVDKNVISFHDYPRQHLVKNA